MKTRLLFAILNLLFFENLRAQDTLQLPNPSFEMDTSQCYRMPTYWKQTGTTEHLPSIQPGCHGVSMEAGDGLKYISLLRYANGTRQCIGAKFQEGGEMKKGEDYEISLQMAQEPTMRVKGESKENSAQTPSGLRIWGVSSLTEEYELLVETAAVSQQEWTTYSLVISPIKRDYDMLYFEPCPALDEGKDGSILIDNISPVVKLVRDATLFSISLKNPSFEDLPQVSKTPAGWKDYGPLTETPPDIQPGAFECTLAPRDGVSYLGLVVRDNNTFESVGQRLQVPLQQDSQYVFTAWLARSALYMSTSKITRMPANYATPVVLRIWGVNNSRDRELLATSPLITHTEWLKSRFMLRPKNGTWKHLVLEAYYKNLEDMPYNGNLLIDKCAFFAVRN